MSDQYNKFNSKSGFEFNIDNVVSKIRLDFDTNVENPNNYILGLNAEQTEFVLIDPNLINNTNQTENTFDLAIQDFGFVGKVNNYVFEKLVDPSIVGCSNCNADSVISELFTETGDLPIINREVIAEFEINPNAVHSLEIELVGHRKICDDSGNCFNDSQNWMTDYISEYDYLQTKPLYITGATNISNSSALNTETKKSLFNFIDYSCCPCCDAYSLFLNGDIEQSEYETICENSNKYIKIDGVSVTSFSLYCTNPVIKYVDEFEQSKEPDLIRTISMCELIEKSEQNYGSGIDSTLLNCSVITNKSLENLKPLSETLVKNKEETAPNDVVKLTGEGTSICRGCTLDCNPDDWPPGTCEACGGQKCCSCLDACCCTVDPDHEGCNETRTICSGIDCFLRCDQDCPIVPGTNIPCCCPDSPCTCNDVEDGNCNPPPTTTTVAPPPPTTSTTTTPRPVLGYKCSFDSSGNSTCVEVLDSVDIFTCTDDRETCCARCDGPHHCGEKLDPPQCLPTSPTNPTCRKIYQNRGLCEDALVNDPTACVGKTFDCVGGRCIQIDTCDGVYNTLENCKLGIPKDPTAPIQLCGKFVCTSSQQTCQPCVFRPDTSAGFTTLELCNQQTQCNKPMFNCDETKTCPDGRQLLGTCVEICTGGEFTSRSACQSSGCEQTSYGNRWRCLNKVCEFVDICNDPTPQQFPSRIACQQECGDFNCINNICTRQEGPGQFPPDSQNSDLNCLLQCECVWFLQKAEFTTSGCPECQRVCGKDRRSDSPKRGPCTGCDAKGRGCSRCVDTFTSQVECENFKQTRQIEPYTCVGATCIPTSSFDPTIHVNCGQYCSRQECINTCSIPSGYNCVRVGLERKCVAQYCGSGEYPTKTECERVCSNTQVCGYNCVPNRTNPKINSCVSACVTTDETPTSGVGEFRTYQMCQNMCISDYGWLCKGNNCVKGTESTGPGNYETYGECVQRCIIPNQAPCGVAPRKVRT